MSDLIPFSFDGWPVRVVQREGEPWWVLADVCRAVEIANAANVFARLDDEDKDTLHNVEGIADARAQALTIINESGLYSLILTSRKEAARRFKRWVTSEVLPSIRRTGSYGAPAMDLRDPAQLARATAQLVEINHELQAQIGELADRNAALERRLRTDVQVARRVDTLRGEVERLARAVSPAPSPAPSGPLIAMVDLLDELAVPKLGRTSVARRFSLLLKTHALSMGIVPRPDPDRDRLLFERSVVESWRRVEGDRLIAEHIRSLQPQHQLPPEGPNRLVATRHRTRSE